MTTRTFGNFVGGEKLARRTDAFVFSRENPTDFRRIVGDVIFADSRTMDDAVSAADKAFLSWGRETSPILRGTILLRAAQFAERHLEAIAQSMLRETGKTRAEARGEGKKGISILRFNAGQCSCPNGEIIPTESASCEVSTRYRPVGVAALITPWNFPWAVPLWKIAAAFAAGCTVVWKTSPYTPETSEWICKMFMSAGLPNGVLNMVHGNEEAVCSLIGDKRISAVSFTGSNPGGNAVYRMCAEHGIWRVQCEMGGKNAIIVWADADVEAAARATVSGAFVCAGQRCTATSRAIVHTTVYQSYLAAVLDMTQEIKVGPGGRADVTMGSLVHLPHMDRVLAAISSGETSGGTLKIGGNRKTRGNLKYGYFVEPTVFTDVNPLSTLGQEEVFGPVLAILPEVNDWSAAMKLLNGTSLGHAAALFTHDERLIHHCDEVAEVGLRHWNEATTGAEANTPFGGIKGTGIGQREMGPEGIRFFQYQVTNFRNSGPVVVGPSTR